MVEQKVVETKKTSMPYEYQKTYSCVVNPNDNGGEAVTITVDVYNNGDGPEKGRFTNIFIETCCHGVSSTKISLWSVGFDQFLKAMQRLNVKMNG